MNANIFKHEFLSRLKSVLIWSIGIVFLIVFFFSIYPAFSEQAALLNEMMKKFPPELLAAFGMGNMDLASLLGYYSLLFIFVQLCLAIQAGNYGFGLVSVEESELTADFLLTKPVSRGQVLTSKLLAALSCLVITDLIIWATSFISISLFRNGKEYDQGTLLLLLASLLVFQLIFMGIGLLISLLVKRIRSVTPWGLGLAFGAYILSAFSGIFGEVKLELITPFKHMDPAYIVKNAAYNSPLILADIVIIIIAIVVSYWLYIRRDIPAVS
jgi:ABC-2 type transport system permease protein